MGFLPESSPRILALLAPGQESQFLNRANGAGPWMLARPRVEREWDSSVLGEGPLAHGETGYETI